METNQSEMVFGTRGVLEPDETMPEERDEQISIMEIDSQTPQDPISPHMHINIEEDLDESNANISQEDKSERVIPSSSVFSNNEF